MIGFVVTSKTSSIVLRREDISTSSMSGLPFAVESQRLEIHIASNWSNPPSCSTTVFSAIRPVNPEWTSIVLTIGTVFINCLNLFLRYSGIASFSLYWSSIFFTFSLYVYGTSINSPPYSFNKAITFSRIVFSGPSHQLSPCMT